MKLSEAIRAGAKLRPQWYGACFTVVGKVIHSCAIGAAFEGAGFYNPAKLKMPCTVIDQCHLFDGLERWVSRGERFRCPVDGCTKPLAVPTLVAHLNDHHAWTREQIADRVEALGY